MNPGICVLWLSSLLCSFLCLVVGCEPGWSAQDTEDQSGQACFKAFCDPQSREDAERLCQDLAAHLVKIESVAMNRFVHSLMKGHSWFWIGMHKAPGIQASELGWKWPDGSSNNSYTNWHPTRPTGKGDC